VEQKSKWHILIFVILFLLVGNLYYSKGGCPLRQSSNTNPLRTIAVSAQAEVKTKPNLAIVNLGVQAIAPKLSTAISQANTKMNALIEKLKALGIEEKDMQSNISSSPQQDYESGKARITGYEVNNSLTLNIHNLEQVSTILDIALDLGVNNISNVTWTMDEFSTPRSQAREMATKTAIQKAEQLAKSAGVKLGKIVSLSENMANSFNPYAQNVIGRFEAKMPLRAEVQDQAPAISAGSVAVTVNVDAIFEVRD